MRTSIDCYVEFGDVSVSDGSKGLVTFPALPAVGAYIHFCGATHPRDLRVVCHRYDVEKQEVEHVTLVCEIFE